MKTGDNYFTKKKKKCNLHKKLDRASAFLERREEKEVNRNRHDTM